MRNMSDSVSPRSWVAPHISSLPKSGIRDFFELVQAMDDVISLGVGEPDFNTPWGIREATIYALDRGRTSYTSNLGMPQCRKAICEYVRNEFDLDYAWDKECIITVGVSEALDLILRAILSPGDEVIYHEPCYVSYSPIIKMAHAVPVPVLTVEKDDFALDPAALEAKITPKTKAILLNFPNNPTGANLSYDQKKEIARIAVKHDVLVITDEIYAELTYDELTQNIALFPGMRERTVFLHGLSKAYAMTGYRMGYACGPSDLIDAMMKIHQYTMLCASIIAQDAAIEAFKNGKDAMIEMKQAYFQRRNVIVNRLNGLGLKTRLPEGAFYAFTNISSTGLTDKEFAHQLLQQQQVAVVPGSGFTNDPSGHNYVRCAYATNIDTLEEATRRMGLFLKSLKKS